MDEHNKKLLAQNLPDIPGVPIDVIILFMETLKSASKYFSKLTKSYTCYNVLKDSDNSAAFSAIESNNSVSAASTSNAATAATTTTVHDSLMNRIQTAVSSKEDETTKVEEAERLDRMNSSLRRWLEIVKRFARSSNSKSTNDDTTPANDSAQVRNEEEAKKKNRRSVPYSCFLYLWEIQQDHIRVPVRRAALLMSAPLLQKSCDCRSYLLEQDNNLSKWINSVVAEGVTWKNQDQAQAQLPLFQKEGFAVLSYLIEEGYTQYYPKLEVAHQRLVQRCGYDLLRDQSDEETAYIVSSETNIRRKVRDIALEYGQKEIKTVQKLLARCQTCLDILVPRIGIEPSSSDTKVINATDNKSHSDEIHDNDDDDDDLEWEDGDDFSGEDDVAAKALVPDQVDHLTAVERTLATMKASAGFHDGGIEIDLARADDEDLISGITGSDPHQKIDPQVLSKLEKHVKRLAGTHMLRLTGWIDALTNADNLVTSEKSGALISLPLTTSNKRRTLVTQLQALKQDVSSILSSFGLLQGTAQQKPTGESTSTTFVASESSTSLQIQSVSRIRPDLGLQSRVRFVPAPWERQQQRKRLKQKKLLSSNRIEIKLRK